MEDSRIIALYWQRDEAAIGETQTKYGPYCFTVASNILRRREDAEECVSDTWLRAWNAMPPQKPGNLKMFLAKITRNLSLDRYRAQSAQRRGGGESCLPLDELAECLPAAGTVAEQLEAQELVQCVNRFLHSLPERECNVFLRRYFFAEPVEAIARRYTLKPGTAAMLLSRCRGKLKKHLEKEGYFL